MSSCKILIVENENIEEAKRQLAGEGYTGVDVMQESVDTAFAEGGGITTGLVINAAIVVGTMP